MNKLSPFYWENWNRKVFFFPISFAWLWYVIRSRSVWFFTPSNPSITFGGMEGEPKEEMYERLPKGRFPTTFYVYPGQSLDSVLERIEASNILFPLAVKPTVGSGGLMFRRITTVQQLEEYHRHCAQIPYMVQAFINYPIEVSVFYYRMPDEATGTISALLLKKPMQVKGDGKRTLEELVVATQEGKKHLEELMKGNEAFRNKVIPSGQTYQVNYAANRGRGGRFFELKAEIDAALLQVFDQLSHHAGDWYYGRWDLMCQSLADLKANQHYSILEYNGAGASPNHIFFNGYSVWGAYRQILKHWRMLFRISRASRQHGIVPWPFWKGLTFLRQTNRHLDNLQALDNQLKF